MFVLKNAWNGVTRHKACATLLVITAVVVSFGSVVGAAILDANTTATTTAYDKLEPAVNFRADRTAIIARYGGDASKVDWTKYHLSWTQYSDYVQKSGVGLSTAYSAETAKVTAEGIKPTRDGATIALTGFSDATATKNPVNGPFTIVDGKDIAYDENGVGKLLVPKALAEKNHLKVGDTIKLTNPKDAKQTLSMTIAGIYENKEKVNADVTGIDPDNTIYTSAYTSSTLGLVTTGDSSTENDLDVTMVLKSAADYDTFRQGVRKAGLSKYFTISSSTIEDYNAKIAPLKALAGKTRVALVVLDVAGGVVALLLVVVAIRRRMEDIGFLMSIGVTRGRIGWQFSLETMLPILLGWIVGTTAGAFSSAPISNMLAANANATIGGGTIWTMVWTGLAVLLATIIVCEVRAAIAKPQDILASRIQEAR
ncbi:ABC transporter permease [Bifidobacterium sp. 82T24]|uniref:FtsX-like permease family protein n=1 Tax=Bifidobacterium pluvialisilvae TaxID=2834436 RepID=UPI001C59261D|nr:ABC transporter permease [Bifidobacterium pluvialisilvae]MBW3087430.1 ABC transporter permease [Bifidobacterium pluvialisilvae]